MAKPRWPFFFAFDRKRGYCGDLGRARGGVGAKRGRCRGGCIGVALTQRDGARYHLDGVGKMDAQRLKLD